MFIFTTVLLQFNEGGDTVTRCRKLGFCLCKLKKKKNEHFVLAFFLILLYIFSDPNDNIQIKPIYFNLKSLLFCSRIFIIKHPNPLVYFLLKSILLNA